MNKRISELYQAMLFELHDRLEEADRIFIRISELLLDMMSTEALSETQKPELRELDRQHRELLAEVVTELRSRKLMEKDYGKHQFQNGV